MGKINGICKPAILVKQKQFKCVLFNCDSSCPPNKYNM